MSKFAGLFYALTLAVLFFFVPPSLAQSETVNHFMARSCDGGQLAVKNESEANADQMSLQPAKARPLYIEAAKVWFTCAHTTSDEYVQGWARVFWASDLGSAVNTDEIEIYGAQVDNALSNLIHDTKYPDVRNAAKQELAFWKELLDLSNELNSFNVEPSPIPTPTQVATCYDAVISNVSGDAYWPVTEIQIFDTRARSNRYYEILAQYWDQTKDWSVDDSVTICDTDLELTNSHQPIYRIENADKATVAHAVEE